MIRFYFYHYKFHIQYKCCSEKYLPLLVYNNHHLLAQITFVFLVCLVSFLLIHHSFRCVCLRKTYSFIFKTTYTFFLQDQENNWLTNHTKCFKWALFSSFFSFFFCSNLSLPSIQTIYGLKNSSSISLLIFYYLIFKSLYFNSLSFKSLFLSL